MNPTTHNNPSASYCNAYKMALQPTEDDLNASQRIHSKKGKKGMPGRPSHVMDADGIQSDAAMTTQWNQTIINTMQENGCEGTLEKCLIKQETRECRVQIVLKFGPKIARKQKSFSYKKFGYDGALLRADSYRRFVQGYKRLPSFQEEEKFFRDPSMALDMKNDEDSQKTEGTNPHDYLAMQQQGDLELQSTIKTRSSVVAPVMVTPGHGHQDTTISDHVQESSHNGGNVWSHVHSADVSYRMPGGAASTDAVRSAMNSNFAHPYHHQTMHSAERYGSHSIFQAASDVMSMDDRYQCKAGGPMRSPISSDRLRVEREDDSSSATRGSPRSRYNMDTITPAPRMCRAVNENHQSYAMGMKQPRFSVEDLQDSTNLQFGAMDYFVNSLQGAARSSSSKIERRNKGLAWLNNNGSLFPMIAEYLELKDVARVEQTCFLARKLVTNSTSIYASALVAFFSDETGKEMDSDVLDGLKKVFIGRMWGWMLPSQRHSAFAKLQLAFVHGFLAGQAMQKEATRLYGSGYRAGEAFPTMKTPTSRANRKQVKNACKTMLSLSHLERLYPSEASALRHLIRTAEKTWVRWAL